MIEALLQDIRFGLRMILRAPVFSAIIILTLAFGIGANAVIFSAVNAILLRPLPYKDSERLVAVDEKTSQGDRSPLSLPDFEDFRNQNQVFDEMAAYQWRAYTLSNGDNPEQFDGWMVSRNFFEMLGVGPILGRTFAPDEDRPGANPVILISEGLWRRRFGASPGLIDQALVLNNTSYTVIGIIPASFKFYDQIDLWTPIGPQADSMMFRHIRPGLYAVGRLRHGISIDQARANLSGLAQQLERQYPRSNTGVAASLVPLQEDMVGDTRTPLFILLGAVAFVLLMACVNVANMLLARLTTRRREIAVRSAMGASFMRLVRLLLTESLLQAAVGGAIGLFLAIGGIRLLIAILPLNTPRLAEIGLDTRVLLFTIAISVATAFLVGLMPAFQASKADVGQALKEGGRTGSQGGSGNRLRGALVTAEVALAVVLLAGAGLMIKSFFRLQSAELGFNPDNLLIMRLSLRDAKYNRPGALNAFYQQLTSRVESLPGVEGPALATPSALGSWSNPLVIEDRPTLGHGELPWVDFAIVSPAFFRTMNITVLSGRDFTEQDTDGAPGVVIVDEVMARSYWPNESPIGKRIKLDDGSGATPDSRWLTVVGVARQVKNYSRNGKSRIEMYVTVLQSPRITFRLLVRTASEPMKLAPAVRQEILEVDKSQPVADVSTMQQEIALAIGPQRLITLLLTAFGGFALLFALLGIYGVIDYSVRQRSHEIGVRMALGAPHGTILRMIIGGGLKLTLIGVVIGMVLAYGLTRVLTGMLYGVKPADPLTFAMISGLFTAVSLFACYFPGRRATKINPIEALRNE